MYVVVVVERCVSALSFCLLQPQPMSTVMLDRVVDSENEDMVHRKEEGLRNRSLGVEVAEPYYRHMDYETSTESYCGSKDSIPGYYSSSQAPDDHYESSDYRVCMLGGVKVRVLCSCSGFSKSQ